MWRERRTLERSDGLIGVSEHSFAIVQETFCGVPILPRRTIYCPLTVSDPVAAGDTEVRGRFVLFAGYVSRSKGADHLARLMRPVMEEHTDLRLIYAGSANQGPVPMQAEILDTLGPRCAGRCTFLGFVDKPVLHQLMRQALCFAFPSRLETFGLVVGEAMLAGCPVITNRAAPFTEYLEDGVTGLLCDSDQEWVQGLRSLIESDELAKRLASRAQAEARTRFSVERCVGETLAFYEELIAARRARKN